MRSIEPFFSFFIESLEKSGVCYCICGNYHQLPHHTDNDIDIWVEDHVRAFSLLNKAAQYAGYRMYLSNRTANGSNNFFYQHHGASFKFLHVDLLTEVAWKSVFQLIPAQFFKSNAVRYKNFNVANDHLDAVMHFVYPLVTLGVVRDKYREACKVYCETELFSGLVKRVFGEKLGRLLLEKIQNSEWEGIQSLTHTCRKQLLLRSFPGLFSLKRLTVAGRFVALALARLFYPTGVSIAFIGPDGAGKTTVIRSISSRMNHLCPRNMFRQMYWRPFLLPELNKFVRLRKPITFNYDSTDFFYFRQRQVGGGVHKKIVYMIKFIYYWLDFIIGFFKIIPITSRGGVVCFDRYYHDQLVYPERFGFSLNRRLMSFMAKFIYKPDLEFVLCPSSEILLARKQEMPPEEVQRQVSEYKQIAVTYGFVHIENTGSVTETSDAILSECLNYMSERYGKYK